MKIFAIYLRLNLIQKPEWFDNFRQKYSEPVDLHITLIQPRYIDETRVDDIKLKVSNYLNESKFGTDDKTIKFSNIVCDKEVNGTYTIMLLAENADKVLFIQKGLKELLMDSTEYVDQVTIDYEENFRPHITIGTNIDKNTLDTVQSCFQSNNEVAGVLTDLVIPIVKDTSLQERMDINNQIILDL